MAAFHAILANDAHTTIADSSGHGIGWCRGGVSWRVRAAPRRPASVPSSPCRRACRMLPVPEAQGALLAGPLGASLLRLISTTSCSRSRRAAASHGRGGEGRPAEMRRAVPRAFPPSGMAPSGDPGPLWPTRLVSFTSYTSVRSCLHRHGDRRQRTFGSSHWHRVMQSG